MTAKLHVNMFCMVCSSLRVLCILYVYMQWFGIYVAFLSYLIPISFFPTCFTKL